MSNRVNVDQLLSDFRSAAETSGFQVESYGEAFGYPLLTATRATKPSRKSRQIYLSTGIHGDEPAPPLALLQLLKNDALPHTNHYTLCPCMNPAGLAAGTRENPDGIDLNRDYTDFASTEIRTHRDWIEANITALDLALHLHEDWEAKGFYFYELNFHGHYSHADALLAAAKKHLPIDTDSTIDGHPANGGIIRPPERPHVPEGLPEALYFEAHYNLLDYTIETPSCFPLDQRIQAMQVAVLAAIE